MAIEIVNPITVYTSSQDGQPIKDGYLFIGEYGLDAQVNPVAVYYDYAMTIPASQPIRIRDGQVKYNGSSGQIYTAEHYSIKIKNKNGVTLYNDTQVDSEASVFTELLRNDLANDTNPSKGAALVGYRGRTQYQKNDDFVSVKDFGAVGDGVTNDTAAIMNAKAFILAAGGGKIKFPAGNYVIDKNTFNHTTNDTTLILEGDGPTATYLSCNDASAGFIIKSNLPASNVSHFGVRDLCINGSQAGIAIHLQGNQANINIENVVIQNVNICLQLEGVFNSIFTNLRMRNYIVGVQGDPTLTALPAQNNTFISCHFSSGISTAAKAINSVNMGQIVYENCDFETGGLLSSIDMRGGTGFDSMLGCRFERLNSAVNSWLYPGRNQYYIGCTWHVSGDYNVVDSSWYLLDFDADSIGCVVEDMNISNTNYASNAVRFQGGSRQNKVRFAPIAATTSYDAIYNLVTDVSAGDNVVEYPGNAFEKNTSNNIADTWGGGPTNQWIMDSFALSTFTFDGLTNSAGPSGASQAALGPHGCGYTRDLNTPTGNKRAYFTLSGATAAYTYIASIWVLPKTANDVVEIAFDSNLANPTWRPHTLTETNRWRRIWIAFKATSTTAHYFQIRASSGCYVFGPQLEEWGNDKCRLGPSGYIPTTVATGGQNYAFQQNPAPFSKREMIGLAAPTVGRYTQGDRVMNAAVAVGQPKSWVCTVSGSPGTWVSEGNL